MPETIFFNSRRMQRAQRVQAARHVLVGAVLALTCFRAVTSGHWIWADLVGLVGGAVLIAAFVVELRHARRPGQHAPHGVGWVDVFAAIVTGVEAWHLHHQGKHGLPFVYGFVALMLLAVGLAHPRLARLRRLIVSDEGFDLRMTPWRRIHAPWSRVASISSEGAVVTIGFSGGRTERFDFSDADNGAHVVETFTRAAQRLEQKEPPPPAGPA